MKKYEYPLGNPVYFAPGPPGGEERKLKDVFGIVKAEITAPNDLYAPILLSRVKNFTIAGIGT